MFSLLRSLVLISRHSIYVAIIIIPLLVLRMVEHFFYQQKFGRRVCFPLKYHHVAIKKIDCRSRHFVNTRKSQQSSVKAASHFPCQLLNDEERLMKRDGVTRIFNKQGFFPHKIAISINFSDSSDCPLPAFSKDKLSDCNPHCTSISKDILWTGTGLPLS